MSLSKCICMTIVMALLSGCGFRPIFVSGVGSTTLNEMRFIEIRPIENRIGQQLRNNLEVDIAPQGRAYPTKYYLIVVLSQNKQDLAIKKSKIATRANLNFRAAYTLVNKDDGSALASGSARITTKYNVLTETFATLMAEKDARARAVREISADIVTKVAVYFDRENGK